MTRGLVLAPPPVARGATPPARIPPTQTMFARGPEAVGIRATDATNYYDFFHYWAVGIGPPRRYAAPLRRGELVTFPSRSKFPSIGGEGPQGGVVREYGIRYLVPFVIARE